MLPFDAYLDRLVENAGPSDVVRHMRAKGEQGRRST
jgi:hypothetical protein